MRGSDPKQEGMFSYVSPEQRVPAEHPLRPLRTMVDDILKEMSPRFAKLYADRGRPSIPPERLLRALLLQILYTVRSERLLMEQLNYNLLFRWFVGMGMDEVVSNHAVFSKNRERLLNEEVAEVFFQRMLERAKPYLSNEHFTVDGTLIEAWASHKSFRPKDGGEGPSGNGREVDFHREKRSNETHQSTTDPDARLCRKSKAEFSSSFELLGAPEQMADRMGDIIEQVGGDGFLITTHNQHLGRSRIIEVTEGLVPALQRRGLSSGTGFNRRLGLSGAQFCV